LTKGLPALADWGLDLLLNKQKLIKKELKVSLFEATYIIARQINHNQKIKPHYSA
jgi:hypothetical protein